MRPLRAIFRIDVFARGIARFDPVVDRVQDVDQDLQAILFCIATP
jgi:hypothetical protein